MTKLITDPYTAFFYNEPLPVVAQPPVKVTPAKIQKNVEVDSAPTPTQSELKKDKCQQPPPTK